MSITREEIRELCAAHDKLMAEQASEPIRRLPVSETGDAGLIYKEFDNSALRPAPAADTDWSAWERWLRGHLNIERRGLLDALEKDMRGLVNDLRKEWRQEIDHKLAELRTENAELRGRVDTLLSLLQTKGTVVDLPRGFWRRDGVA